MDSTRKLSVMRADPRTRTSLSLFLWLTDFSFTSLQIKSMAESLQTCVWWFFPSNWGDQHFKLRMVHYLLLLPPKGQSQEQASTPTCSSPITPLLYQVKFQDARREIWWMGALPIGCKPSLASFLLWKGISRLSSWLEVLIMALWLPESWDLEYFLGFGVVWLFLNWNIPPDGRNQAHKTQEEQMTPEVHFQRLQGSEAPPCVY